MIKENNMQVKVLVDKCNELSREIMEHKRHTEMVTSTRDVKFQDEVKSILDH